jgi:hypothetical protein
MDISLVCGCHTGTRRVYGPPCWEKRRLVRANPSMPGSCTLTLIYDAICDKGIVSLGMVNWSHTHSDSELYGRLSISGVAPVRGERATLTPACGNSTKMVSFF